MINIYAIIRKLFDDEYYDNTTQHVLNNVGKFINISKKLNIKHIMLSLKYTNIVPKPLRGIIFNYFLDICINILLRKHIFKSDSIKHIKLEYLGKYRKRLSKYKEYKKLIGKEDTITEQECIKLMNRYPFLLKYVTKQSTNICNTAVSKNGIMIKYVIEQTYDNCILAIKNNYKSMKYIRDQSIDLCEKAIEINIGVLKYIVNK